MTAMFWEAVLFGGRVNTFTDPSVSAGDISKWDVSRVTDMSRMFANANLFNGDISNWDVSRVTNMDHMFLKAVSFKRKLCGAAWVHSKASKEDMFANTMSGSIP